MSQTLEMAGQKEVFRQMCGLVGWKAEAECDLDSQSQSCCKIAQCVCRAEGPVGQQEEGWRMGCRETTVGHTGPEG